MTDTTNLGLPCIEAAQAQKHVTHNDALRIFDALVQIAIVDRDLSTPPALAEEGQRWIVATGGTDTWSGHDNAIAAWQDGGWQFYAPKTGWLAYAADEGVLLVWSGAVWVDALSAITALQNLTRLGLGTAADATNPLSAKLNNALFAARTVAEGGDGTLRYRLSKESADKTLSLLFQDNFSGRAEIGLTGDDDFHLKVSGDGENWVEAVVIDNQSGEATLAAPATIRTDTGIVLNLDLDGGDGVFQATRYAAGPSAPVFFGRKARGTRDAPEAVQAGDTLIGFRGYAYTGTEFLRAAEGVAFLLEAAENISDSAYGTQIRFFTTLNGTTTIEERVRIAHDGALQMGGENTVVDANRHFMLRAYTVATLPQATVPGQLIYVSDGAANKRLAVSDGTGWRWSDGTTVT